MKALNKIVKFFGYIGIGIVTYISSYIIALVFMCTPLSLFCSVWSICRALPAIMVDKYWLVLLVSSLPMSVVFFIIAVKNIK